MGSVFFHLPKRSLLFHGSSLETKGGTSLEGSDFFVSKIEIRKCGVLQYIILFVWRKWGKNTNFVPWNCIFPWKTGRVSSVENKFFTGSGLYGTCSVEPRKSFHTIPFTRSVPVAPLFRPVFHGFKSKQLQLLFLRLMTEESQLVIINYNFHDSKRV